MFQRDFNMKSSSFFAAQDNIKRSRAKFIGASVVTLLALSVLLGSLYTIDQGERGVLLRFGAVKATIEPGAEGIFQQIAISNEKMI